MKAMSVRDSERAFFAVAYTLTRSPGTSLKSSRAITLDPDDRFSPGCAMIRTAVSGPPLTG